MKDDKGLYYHPQPGEKKVRVYVRRGRDNAIEFRLWEAEHPVVWEKHGWIPTHIIQQAAHMYKEMGKETDPLTLYDENVARALLAEDGQ